MYRLMILFILFILKKYLILFHCKQCLECSTYSLTSFSEVSHTISNSIAQLSPWVVLILLMLLMLLLLPWEPYGFCRCSFIIIFQNGCFNRNSKLNSCIAFGHVTGTFVLFALVLPLLSLLYPPPWYLWPQVSVLALIALMRWSWWLLWIGV